MLAAALWGYLTAKGGGPSQPPRLSHLPRTLAIWLPVWWAPVALAAATGATLLTDIGLYFSRLAVVTFGGAYAVLAWMTQTAVAEKGWLTTAAMIDGLGLAETTPGPLILVTEFVGFQAGYGASGIALGLAAVLGVSALAGVALSLV